MVSGRKIFIWLFWLVWSNFLTTLSSDRNYFEGFFWGPKMVKKVARNHFSDHRKKWSKSARNFRTLWPVIGITSKGFFVSPKWLKKWFYTIGITREIYKFPYVILHHRYSITRDWKCYDPFYYLFLLYHINEIYTL